MKNRIYIFLTLLVILNSSIISELFADVGHFDICEVIWNDKIYYLKVDSPGQLFNDDLCYYDYNGDYVMEVESHINKFIQNSDEIRLYASLIDIRVDSIKLSNGAYSLESPIFILKDLTKIQAEKLLNLYELLSAKKGNTYGIIISPNLSKEDESWINTSETKELFVIGEYFCSYHFYSPEIPINSLKSDSIRRELNKLLPNIEADFDQDKSDKLWMKIEELIDIKIVMIGGCSC